MVRTCIAAMSTRSASSWRATRIFWTHRLPFSDLKAGTWGGKGEIALFGDLGVLAVDKAVAIDRLLGAIHAKREDTIAFGDAKVDIPMFEYCAIGVAMGSGGEEAKAAADYDTDAVDRDGLYHAFRHFHLIEA